MSKSNPSRSDIRAFGKRLSKGDRVVNRFKEHGHPRLTRVLTVVADVRSMPFFILEDAFGKTVWMRTRTLFARYDVLPRGYDHKGRRVV